jgi:hypothetical protein
MNKRRGSVQRTLADSVWLIPLLFVLGGIALALGLIAALFDSLLSGTWLSGSATARRVSSHGLP